MADLLRTKLVPPRLRAALVPRAALVAQLNQGLERKLTLLAAPAGFGKTTLVRQWLSKLRIENEELSNESASGNVLNSHVAWLSLDSGDDDPVRFLHYLIAACQLLHPDLGVAALAQLDTAPQPRFDAVLTALINDLAGLDGRGILVLEDYHIIDAPQVHDLVAFLLDHLPAALHIMLLTRGDPPLPLARLRAQGELSELRAADLRFAPDETRAFLRQSMPFPLSAEAVARLDARTEGWVAGLRLAALALQGRQEARDVDQVLATFAGSHRHVVEYLVADVLAAQPAALQEFLLRTSILARLTGSLCDAVTGRDDSAAILDQLEHANLFLLEIGDQGSPTLSPQPPIYRYHALFAEAMQREAQRRLGDAALEGLRERASHWYEQHGLLAEAIDDALAARSFTRAAALLDRIISPARFYSELRTLRRWVEALPEALLAERPALCFAYATALLFTEDRSAPATQAMIEAPLRLAEERWRAEGDRPRLGVALAFRSLVAWWQSDTAQAFAAARQALTLLPEDEHMWRGSSLLNIGTEELLAGRIDAARAALLEGRAHCEVARNDYAVRAATLILGELSIRQGELRQAAQLYDQVLAAAGEDLVDQAHALIGLATLAYERNDLEAAERNLSQALEISERQAPGIGEQFTDEALVAPGSLLLARVLHARGQAAQARELLHTLGNRALQRRRPQLQREVLAWQARLALAAGDLGATQRWATDRAQRGDDAALLEQERDALIFARLLIVRGETGTALRALERWRETAQAQGRASSTIEATALMALAHFAANDLPAARRTLAQALALAQAEGFRRVFLDEGEQMASLLRAALPGLRDEPQAAFGRALLQEFSTDQATHRPGDKQNTPHVAQAELSEGSASPSLPVSLSLVEPLSPQEQRVLRLLAAGLSNPEIADELVVSVNTVKTQVQSIYRKLNISSRREARAAIRQLNLS